MTDTQRARHQSHDPFTVLSNAHLQRVEQDVQLHLREQAWRMKTQRALAPVLRALRAMLRNHWHDRAAGSTASPNVIAKRGGRGNTGFYPYHRIWGSRTAVYAVQCTSLQRLAHRQMQDTDNERARFSSEPVRSSDAVPAFGMSAGDVESRQRLLAVAPPCLTAVFERFLTRLSASSSSRRFCVRACCASRIPSSLAMAISPS